VFLQVCTLLCFISCFYFHIYVLVLFFSFLFLNMEFRGSVYVYCVGVCVVVTTQKFF